MRIMSAYDVHAMEVPPMQKANMELDTELVQRCLQETGIQTVGALIDHAIRELLRHERQKKAIKLKERMPSFGLFSHCGAGLGPI